jgi:hypothetical protein
MKVEVSPGELVDRLTILEIKLERFGEPAKREHVAREYEALRAAYVEGCYETQALAAVRAELKAINAELWRIEDAIRDHERRGDFGSQFVELARGVYLNNDRRSALKRRINELLGSTLAEEKSYSPY